VLDALSIAIGSWFLGLRGHATRHIRPEEVHLHCFTSEPIVNWGPQFPCKVEARGVVQGKDLSWHRTLNAPGGRTTYVEAREIKDLAEQVDEEVRDGKPIVLPLISYYGTGRLWNVPRERAQVSEKKRLPREGQSRLTGYRLSVDPRLSASDLAGWIARQSWMAFQQHGKATAAYEAVCDDQPDDG